MPSLHHRSVAAGLRARISTHDRLGPVARRIRRALRVGAPDLPGWEHRERWEAVRAAGLFDAEWYVRTHPAVEVSGLDPLHHYAAIGSRLGLDPNPLFDTAWYRDTYGDVTAIRFEPLLHYAEFGVAEGRDPSPRFDTVWYLQSNADVRRAGLNPLGHYLTHGLADGRRPRPRPDRPFAGGPVEVVVVSGEEATPGHLYRAERFAAAVRRLGGHATVLSLPEAAMSRRGSLDRADVVLLWRTAWGPETEDVVEQARRAGAVILFDVDDLMVDPEVAVAGTVDGIRSQDLTEAEARDWFAKMARTASAADAAIGTTETLAAHLRKLGLPVHVLPNGFEDATVVRSQLARRMRAATPDDGLFRFGYAAGSLTHQRDFQVVADAMADVLRTHPHGRLVLFRRSLDLDEFPAFDDLRDQIEWRDLVPLSELPFEVARFDVNLAPLEVGNPFCEAKSNLKFFEAALVDVATAASPTEPYRRAMTDGVDGVLADGHDSWRTALHALIDDPVRTAAMGRAAQRTVLWRYGPTRHTQAVSAVLAQRLDPQAGAEAFELELLRSQRPPEPPPLVVEHRVLFERDRLRSPLVTVVVPVHDYADVLVDALDSAAAQTLGELDLIVVDDSSGDDSAAVARAWLDAHANRFGRAVLVAHTTNSGVAAARNLGFDLASTPYVLTLDADNELLPTCAARLLDVLDGTAAVFAYPRIVHFGDTSELLSTDQVRGYLPYDPQRLVASNHIDAMALIRRDAWLAAGGYRAGLLGWEDYDLWCRFAELGLRGVQVAEDLARYRVHARSMLHTTTHAADGEPEVHAVIRREHPWLRLEDRGPVVAPDAEAVPRPTRIVRTTEPKVADGGPDDGPDAWPPPGELSERVRRLLPLLRDPETGEHLAEHPDGGLVSVERGRRWPVVAGRPVLDPGRETAEVFPVEHLGNPMAADARRLIAETTGWVLHLSGGGTRADADNVIEVDWGIYGNTDVSADAHRLPFANGELDLVVALNAFEHYADPPTVVREIERVLRPGGLVYLHTAFLQPLHEAPHHYFNVTRYGLERWFEPFELVDLQVTDNLHPGYAVSWLASEVEEVVAADVSDVAAAELRDVRFGTLSDWWRDPSTRVDDDRWAVFSQLSAAGKERAAAGFAYLGRRRGGPA